MSDGVPVFQDTSLNPPPPLKNELVVDRLASIPVRSRYEALKKEATELESQIKQLHDALDTLLRIQQRYVHFSFYCKRENSAHNIDVEADLILNEWRSELHLRLKYMEDLCLDITRSYIPEDRNIKIHYVVTFTLKFIISSDMMMCCSVRVHGRFGGKYRLHLYGKRYGHRQGGSR
jgi:hypothetical protein